MRQGTRGAAWDLCLYVRDWDFGLDEIRIPLRMFHGEQDVNAPIQMVRRAMTLLPTAPLVTYENDAHLSTLANHLEEIAVALTGEQTTAAAE
jgi:pimeloyl-ACP methyl ester carboxylesterase